MYREIESKTRSFAKAMIPVTTCRGLCWSLWVVWFSWIWYIWYQHLSAVPGTFQTLAMIRTRLHRFVMYTYTRTIKIVALIAGLIVPHALVDLKCIPLLTNFLELFLQHGLSLVKQGMKEALSTFTSNIVTSTWLPTFLCPASLLGVVCFFCKVLGGLKDTGITQQGRAVQKLNNDLLRFSSYLNWTSSLRTWKFQGIPSVLSNTPRSESLTSDLPLVHTSKGWWSGSVLRPEVVSGSMLPTFLRNIHSCHLSDMEPSYFIEPMTILFQNWCTQNRRLASTNPRFWPASNNNLCGLSAKKPTFRASPSPPLVVKKLPDSFRGWWICCHNTQDDSKWKSPKLIFEKGTVTPPWKLTYPLKIDGCNMEFLFYKWSLIRGRDVLSDFPHKVFSQHVPTFTQRWPVEAHLRTGVISPWTSMSLSKYATAS